MSTFFLQCNLMLSLTTSYSTSDDREGCVESIQWLRGKYTDISAEYEEMTDLIMWGNSGREIGGNGFLNDVIGQKSACTLFVQNITHFER